MDPENRWTAEMGMERYRSSCRSCHFVETVLGSDQPIPRSVSGRLYRQLQGSTGFPILMVTIGEIGPRSSRSVLVGVRFQPGLVCGCEMWEVLPPRRALAMVRWTNPRCLLTRRLSVPDGADLRA